MTQLRHWRGHLFRVLRLGPRRLFARPGRLVVDLSQTPTVDADGIDLLLDLHRRSVAAGGELVLRAPNSRVRRLLELARVSGVLTIEERQAEALR